MVDNTVIETTLAANVASGGTFTVGYPTGLSAGSFVEGKGHKLIANQTTFDCPDDFTISFGASAATITYNGSTTIPSGSRVVVELAQPGLAYQGATFNDLLAGSVRELKPIHVSLGSPLATDDDVLRAAASISASGALTLLATSFDIPRNIIITSSGNDSGLTFTCTGTDVYGVAMQENITGANTGIASGVKAFYGDIAISASGASAGTVKIGRGNVFGLPVYVPGLHSLQNVVVNGELVTGPSAGVFSIPFYAEQVSVLAGTAAAIEIVAPCDLEILQLSTQVRVAVGTGGAVTVKNGTTDVVGLSITIADSATKGTQQTDTPTSGDATTLVSKGGRIQIVFADAFATTGAIDGVLTCLARGSRYGTLVAGLSQNTKPTATNADIRGTWAPGALGGNATDTPDGTKGIELVLLVEDPGFLGNTQYLA